MDLWASRRLDRGMRIILTLIVACITVPAIAFPPHESSELLSIYVRRLDGPAVGIWQDEFQGQYGDGMLPGGWYAPPLAVTPAEADKWTIQYGELPTGLGEWRGGTFAILN